ncbi:hypothetical protein Mal15_45840 [Stieleria maiorica]|uniref:Uncharacterized protein n=1 Tax=Stieleria maiorica TaxID=2795974 RepID=A0A5B9MHZ1_9BACT|nr:DUF2585 family protein [Stieleria maiorica]QEG00514.1 hypothetical protein Mal15_45840 [Stieleria maiorica]
MPDAQTRRKPPPADQSPHKVTAREAVSAPSLIAKLRLFATLTLIATSMAFVLWRMGRTPWCECGGYSPWSGEINSRHNSQHLIDPYFFTHVLHGILFFAVLWPLRHWLTDRARVISAALVEAGWEILENTPMIIERYRQATISLDYYGDSIANSVADLLACLAGYMIASRLRWYSSLALLVVVEAVLLATIRDSLLLNIIMLVWPSDAIREWQM